MQKVIFRSCDESLYDTGWIKEGLFQSEWSDLSLKDTYKDGVQLLVITVLRENVVIGGLARIPILGTSSEIAGYGCGSTPCLMQTSNGAARYSQVNWFKRAALLDCWELLSIPTSDFNV